MPRAFPSINEEAISVADATLSLDQFDSVLNYSEESNDDKIAEEESVQSFRHFPTSTKPYEFWHNLVLKLTYDKNIYEISEIPSLDILSRYFDSSERGIRRVFNLFDKDNDSSISIEEAKKGLEQQGYLIGEHSNQQALDELFNLIKQNNEIHAPEFAYALKNLRLAALLRKNVTQTMSLHHFEYNFEKLQMRSPIQDFRKLFFSTSNNGAPLSPTTPTPTSPGVNWYHSHDPSISLVLALGVKLGFDVRHTQDVLTLWREQAKIDVKEYVQVIWPVLKLTQRSRDSLFAYRDWHNQKHHHKHTNNNKQSYNKAPGIIVELQHSNLAYLLKDQQICTFSSETGILSKLITDDEMASDKNNNHKLNRLRRSTGNLFDAECPPDNLDDGPVIIHPELSQVFSGIVTDLMQSAYSNLRTNSDIYTFLYKSLVEITDELRLISEAYTTGLNIMHKRLEKLRHRMSLEDVRKVRKCHRQLSHLYRLLRPCLTIMGNKLPGASEHPLYISEIQSNVSSFIESTNALRNTSKQIIDDHHSFSETRMTSVVFVLSIAFTVCKPSQLLSAMYGMNFEHLPELSWGFYGYIFFWVMCIITTALMVAFIYYKSKQHS
jgi:Ca2+-binding EF-hand superfamily protein